MIVVIRENEVEFGLEVGWGGTGGIVELRF